MLRFAIAVIFSASAVSGFAQPNLSDLPVQDGQVREPREGESPASTPTAEHSLEVSQRERCPPAVATQEAISTIHEIFRAEFTGATTPARQIGLAQQLLTQAKRTTNSTDRWALLVEAARLASTAGDVDTTFDVVDMSIEIFALDPVTAKLDAIERLVPKVSADETAGLVTTCLALCRNLLVDERLADAKTALHLAAALTKKPNTRHLAKEVNALTGLVKAVEQLLEEKEAITSKLEKTPDDPSVCLQAGRFFCFKADDWAKGLPLLAKGSDPELAALATSELGQPADIEAEVRRADQWSRWAEQQNSPAKPSALLHALALYRAVLPKVDGLEKLRVQKNIDAAEKLLPTRDQFVRRVGPKIPGLQVWLDGAMVQKNHPARGMRRGLTGSGNRVALWEDLSGNGNHARQDNPALQPIASDATREADVGVTFGGAQALEMPLKAGPAGTLVIVLTPDQVANMQPIGFRNNEQAGLHLSLYATGGIRFEALTAAGFAGSGQQTGDYKSGKKLFITGIWGPSLFLLVNGKESPPSAGGLMLARNDVNWGLGSAVLPNPVVGFRGVIHHVMIFDRALTPQETAQLAGQLMSHEP